MTKIQRFLCYTIISLSLPFAAQGASFGGTKGFLIGRQATPATANLFKVATGAAPTATVNMPNIAQPLYKLIQDILAEEDSLKQKHAQSLSLPGDELLGIAIACTATLKQVPDLVAKLQQQIPDARARQPILVEMKTKYDVACAENIEEMIEFLIPGTELATSEKIRAKFENEQDDSAIGFIEKMDSLIVSSAYSRLTDATVQKFSAVYPTIGKDPHFVMELYPTLRAEAGLDVCDYRLPLFAHIMKSVWSKHLQPSLDYLSGDAKAMVQKLTTPAAWTFGSMEADFGDMKFIYDGDFTKQLQVAFALDESKKAFADAAFNTMVMSVQQILELDPKSLDRTKAALLQRYRNLVITYESYRKQFEDMKAGRVPGVDANAFARIAPSVEKSLDDRKAYIDAAEKQINAKIAHFNDGSCDIVKRMWQASDSEIRDAKFQAQVLKDFKGKISAEDEALAQQLFTVLP